MVSKKEIIHLNTMANIVRQKKVVEKDFVIVKSEMSIAWAEKLIRYLPLLYEDIIYDKRTRQYKTLSTLSEK